MKLSMIKKEKFVSTLLALFLLALGIFINSQAYSQESSYNKLKIESSKNEAKATVIAMSDAFNKIKLDLRVRKYICLAKKSEAWKENELMSFSRSHYSIDRIKLDDFIVSESPFGKDIDTRVTKFVGEIHGIDDKYIFCSKTNDKLFSDKLWSDKIDNLMENVNNRLDKINKIETYDEFKEYKKLN